MELKKIEKLASNKPLLLKTVAEEYLNNINKERLLNIYDGIETFISDAKSYDNMKEIMQQVVQADLSDFMTYVFEQLGHDDFDTYKLLTGKSDNAVGVLIWDAFEEKQVDKLLNILIEAWIEMFSKEILTKMINCEFYK